MFIELEFICCKSFDDYLKQINNSRHMKMKSYVMNKMKNECKILCKKIKEGKWIYLPGFFPGWFFWNFEFFFPRH